MIDNSQSSTFLTGIKTPYTMYKLYTILYYIILYIYIYRFNKPEEVYQLDEIS